MVIQKNAGLIALTTRLIILVLAVTLKLAPQARGQQFVWEKGQVTYRGNTFKCQQPHLDTVLIEDPITNDMLVKYVQTTPEPQTMNGQKIYKLAELTETNTGHDNGSPVEAFVIEGLRPELATLPDGGYVLQIENVVADETGHIVYYFFPGVRSMNRDRPTPAGPQAAIVRKVDELLKAAPSVKPGLIDGTPVVFLTEVFDHSYHIWMRDHTLSIEKQQ